MLRREDRTMRVLELKVAKIGPFDEAELTFVEDPEREKAPIALITGENGTGKTILLDAIRGMFGQHYAYLERAIWRNGTPFRVEMTAAWEGQQETLTATKWMSLPTTHASYTFVGGSSPLQQRPQILQQGQGQPTWIVDYWPAALATDSYEIRAFQPPAYRETPLGSLQGTYTNASTTNYICYFDYLRSSNDPKEQRVGAYFYDKLGEILSHSLLEGRFEHVARGTFTPMIRQGGQVVPLSNISSGNAYLSARLLSVLWKMYAVFMHGSVPLEETCNVPGLVLIDEAENHLHPRWQKRLFRILHDVFPNLQIIATTHSPFIVASAPGARVFVCRYDQAKGSCVVEDASDSYANKPVDEILASDAFDHTQPFGEEISDLIAARKQAIERGDAGKRKEIEAQLVRKNPEYFSYFDVDERLRALGGAR